MHLKKEDKNCIALIFLLAGDFRWIRCSFAATTTTNSVSLPEGPFNPTNYSGTQVNFWGVAPPGGVAPGVFTGAANPYPSALGAMTNRMLTVRCGGRSVRLRGRSVHVVGQIFQFMQKQ